GQWLNQETDDVVLGSGIGQKLSIGLFDYNRILEVYMAKPGKGAINRPEDAFNRLALHPVGYYFLNDELSQKYVFCDIELSRELLELDSHVFTALEIKKKGDGSEKTLKKEIAKIFNHEVQIKNRTELNASLHRMLNTENLVLYLILTLVLIVTLFTLIGALIMTILDKKSNIKTLFHLGASLKELKFIFLTQGFIICLAGAVIGILLGIILVGLQQYIALFMITPSLPYPVEINVMNVLIVFFTIITLGFLASFIASSRVNEKLLKS
ncbi:MAG: ABC transporter permease, partial [Flavobacterium sp.]